jgi:hypothetical protein
MNIVNLSFILPKIEKRGIKILNPEEYDGMHFKLKARCMNTECNHEWLVTPNNAQRRGCPKCCDKAKSENFRKEIDLVLDDIYSKNGNVVILNPESYINSKGYFKCYCKIHKCEFDGCIPVLIKGGLCCEKCNLEAISGENSWKYNHNLTTEEREKGRTLLDENGMNHHRWRKEIFKIYNYKCAICESKLSRKVRSHHIKPY